MGGDEAVVGEAGDDFAETAEAFFFLLVVAPGFLGVGHDADDGGAESLHARDGAVDFGESELEVTADGFAPIANEGAEFGDGDSGFVELIGYLLKFGFGQLVNVTAIDSAGGNLSPPDFLGGFDLGGEVLGGFVGKSGEKHAKLMAESEE